MNLNDMVENRSKFKTNTFSLSIFFKYGFPVDLQIYDTRPPKQSENLPAVVAKSLDEWVEWIRGKVTPNCFPTLHRETWIHVFKKYNTAVPSSAAVERVFPVGSDVLRPKRASLTAEYFEGFVLLRENEKCVPQSLFLQK